MFNECKQMRAWNCLTTTICIHKIISGSSGDSAEIQRLERELQEERDRVQRLSAQLTTNVSSKNQIILLYFAL